MIAKNLRDSKITEKTIPTVVKIASNELKPRTYIIIVSTEFLDLKSGFILLKPKKPPIIAVSYTHLTLPTR